MKKINVVQALTTFDGKVMLQKTEEGERPLLVKSALVNALLMVERENVTGEVKMARFTLAQMIYKSDGVVDLETADIVMIKKLVNDCYPTLVVGQLYEILG